MIDGIVRPLISYPNMTIADKLLKLAAQFLSHAQKEEEQIPDNSASLSVVLRNLGQLQTFTARKKYAEENLERLSSGSSRLTYLTNQKTVVKLASNEKGLAQNKAETHPKTKSQHLNPTLRHDKNYAWIEVPFLNRLTEKEFYAMTGLDFEQFGEALRYGLRDISGNSDKDKPRKFADIAKTPLYKEMVRIGKACKLMPGDLARISSWGEKDGKPVIIDGGLTQKVFEIHYEDDSTS